MRKPLLFTSTHLFTKSLNRIDALQTYYDGFFHEIESNITPIVANCEQAIAGNKINENLSAIKSTAQYVLRIMDKIARAVKLDLSGIKVERSTFEFGPWLDTFMEDFHAMSRYDKDDEVMFYLNPQLKQASMESDPMMLGQVISYLLSNAFNSSEEGTPVKLKLSELDGQLLVEVHNVGTIPTEDREKLFVAYLKGEETLKGAGFGLYLCSLYVEALNGTIDVSCKKNVTVFSVTFPNLFYYGYNQRA